jgi:hypothetical protein
MKKKKREVHVPGSKTENPTLVSRKLVPVNSPTMKINFIMGRTSCAAVPKGNEEKKSAHVQCMK